MFGSKVWAHLATFARPLVTFFQVNLVVCAVLHPNLEDAFDVHFDHLFFFQAVLGQEKFFKDCIIKCFGAQQPDVEEEWLGDLANFAFPHNWKR